MFAVTTFWGTDTTWCLHWWSVNSAKCLTVGYSRYHTQLLKPWRNFPLWAQMTSYPLFLHPVWGSTLWDSFPVKYTHFPRQLFQHDSSSLNQSTFFFSPSHIVIASVYLSNCQTTCSQLCILPRPCPLWNSDTGKSGGDELGTKQVCANLPKHSTSLYQPPPFMQSKTPLLLQVALCGEATAIYPTMTNELVWTSKDCGLLPIDTTHTTDLIQYTQISSHMHTDMHNKTNILSTMYPVLHKLTQDCCCCDLNSFFP